MPGMSTGRTLLIASAVAAAMVVVGVVAASAANRGAPTNFLAAASPSPKSNEASAHEATEPAARETAENNGTFRPSGAAPGAPGAPGHSNETSTHETGETSAQEAAENARAAATPSP